MIHYSLPRICLHQIHICLQRQWPGLFPFTAPCFSLLLENPKVGASQTPDKYCLTGRSPGPPPSKGRACGSSQDLGTAPSCSSHHRLHIWAVPRHSPWPLQRLLLPKGSFQRQGELPGQALPQGGPQEGPSNPTKQASAGKAWCVSLSGIDLPNSFKYFPFFLI